MINNEWNILDLYFKDHKYPFTGHHLDSYRNFVKVKIPEIIKLNNPITMIKLDDINKNLIVKVEIFVGGEDGDNIYVDRPIAFENGAPKLITPNDARMKNLTYETHIFAKIIVKITDDKNVVKVVEFNNIAIGSNALLGVSATQANSGVRNIAIGAASLQSNTTGEFNTVIGDSSMVQNAVGSYNAIVGQNGLRNNTSGSYNTAIGSDVLRNSTTASFTTAVGALSLFDNLTGDRNIALGYNSGRGITSGRANTIIGSVTGLSAGLSNNIILADGDGNIKYRWDGTLNSISGSTIITGSLTVTGDITAQTLVVQTITSSVLYSS
jgi:hypothetical protein